ncbi:MAG: chemotaxis protein CheW [Nitrospiria bacterium]
MPASTVHQAARCKLLRFTIDERSYVTEIERVREIVFYRPSIPVPHAPAFLQGVIDLRGLAIPLIDLRERLGVPEDGRSQPIHILVVCLGHTVSGLTVDAVTDVLEVEEACFQTPDASETRPAICRGVCRINEDFVLVLNLDAILTHDEQALLAGVV